MNKEIKITDFMYRAYGTDTGILFGIPADLRGSVETIVKIAIHDSGTGLPEMQSRIDRFKDELKVNINAMNAASAKIDRLEASLDVRKRICRDVVAEKAELLDILKRLDAWDKACPSIDKPGKSPSMESIIIDTRAALAKEEPDEGKETKNA